ncbi:hypothetical protein NGRA_3237 [Nosema granulosis]|uniref:Integrase catalytic domain-containing protein n=1 Tax=Nosema granulosis TaxID=83296 RepID=A0A9P6KXD2_9MICR|nr:hypothetical protein NGRA_3237 [Nosema granulosis]
MNTFPKKNIKQLSMPAYTPSSNGISERLNKTISYILSINKNCEINKVVRQAEMALNINFNRNLGISPYNLINQRNFFDPRHQTIEVKPKTICESTKQSTYKI